MLKTLWAVMVVVVVGALCVAGCGKREDGGKRVVKIGMVAKSQSNDVFQAAYSGARDAASELAEKYNVTVEIVWKTPPAEDAAKQVEEIEALTRAGVDAILVSCTDAKTLTPAIDRAAGKGIPVMTFDSDAPASKRFAYYGSDNRQIGEKIVKALSKEMGGKGTVAVLGGNQSGTNLAERVAAAKEEIGKQGMTLLGASGGVFYHEETPEKAAEAVAMATTANPGIEGWAMIGGWPLFTKNALKWEPGKIKVVSCDALPAQLDYLKSGHVQKLFAQDCYGWGHKGVEVLLEKVLNKKDPASAIMVDPLEEVTKENVDAYGKKWNKWLGK